MKTNNSFEGNTRNHGPGNGHRERQIMLYHGPIGELKEREIASGGASLHSSHIKWVSDYEHIDGTYFLSQTDDRPIQISTSQHVSSLESLEICREHDLL